MSDYAEAWLAGPQSTQFYTRTYNATSPKAVVVFIHGFAEHVGRYTHIHPRFPQHGISVFTFDQRGFGRTGQDLEHKSKDSSYAKTSWPEQLADIEWAIKHVKNEFAGLPIFLMGHSMGGGLVLGFATRKSSPPDKSTVALLSGIIAGSPLIEQSKPAPKFLRWVGDMASSLAPHTLIPAGVKAEDLSHDSAFNEAYVKDPLIKPLGSLRGVNDMLTGGEQLLKSNYSLWPESLPVLFVHGTEDKVTSHKATETFHQKVPASDKRLTLIEGGFHELQNEPDGVKEKVYDGVIEFIEAHLSTTSKL